MNNDLKVFVAPVDKQKRSNKQKQLNKLGSPNTMPLRQDHWDLNGKRDNNLSDNNKIDLAKWYAVYTKPRFEKKLYLALKKSGFTVFLPIIKEKRIWSDRIKSVEVPLLPSYLFVKLHKNQNHLLYDFPGFVRFVCFEGKHCEIKEKEIRLLRNIERSGLNATVSFNNYRAGDLVRIIKGPLQGWEGRVDRTKGSNVIFHLEGIRQSISVELCAYFVQLAK